MERKNKLTKPEVIERVNDLLNTNQTKLAKYQRSYALYNQSPLVDLKGRSPITVGYQDDIYSDETNPPKLNVIKSCVDSLVSKITTAHCRPFVNAVKGSFKTIQVCKQLQVFFDYYFDENSIQDKIVQALQSACIFDTGYVYIDEDDGSVKNIMPWNVYTRPTEQKNFKSVYIEFPNISLDMLKDSDYKLVKQPEQKGLYTNLGYFYDSVSHTKATLINRQIRDIKTVDFDVMPIVPIYYTSPIIGNTTLSITDMLKGIQKTIDSLMKKIAEASELNPAMSVFVPNASNIKISQLNNQIGNIVQYSSPDGSVPMTVNTPNFIGAQYMQTVNELTEKAFNIVGISQLSAQGKKPQGLDSGVALATQNDIESDRFQVLLDQYIKMFTDIARMAVKVFSKQKDIIEPSRYALRLKWGDVEKEYTKMRIQFSAADSLSKDPSEKLKQLQTLAQAGIIPATQIASLLELPDINRGYSVANNSYNATMTVIDSCIYDDKYDIPDYIPFQMIKEQIVNMELSLKAAQGDTEDNEDDIAKLMKLYEIVEERETTLNENAMQEQTMEQDVALDNQYSPQNNPRLESGTENDLTQNNNAKATPYQTDVVNQKEISPGSNVGLNQNN